MSLKKLDQIDIFDMLFPKYKITKPIRLIELFGGIGSQAKALEKLNVDFESYKVVEVDKYAIASYNAIHGTNFTISDITQVHAKDLEIKDKNQYEYIMTYSFPCQDLSIAGKRKGMSKGSGTRSGLLWEVERILDECDELPQILLMENVPQVISSKNMNDFHLWQKKLEKMGYMNYVSLLNAKNYGIPQNRNRCFMISFLGQYSYNFPKSFELKLKLKDMLESDVDEKYFLSEKMIKFFEENTNKQKERGNGFKFETSEGNYIAKSITTRAGSRMDDNFIKIAGNLKINEYVNRPHQKRRVVQKEKIPTLKTNCNDIGVIVGSTQKNAAINFDGICPSLTSAMGIGGGQVPMHNYEYRIRKLTPLECWRLMGFDDTDFLKAKEINSNSQLYKQAGNSIVVNVLYYIFKELF